jgi:hypothetical protein
MGEGKLYPSFSRCTCISIFMTGKMYTGHDGAHVVRIIANHMFCWARKPDLEILYISLKTHRCKSARLTKDAANTTGVSVHET